MACLRNRIPWAKRDRQGVELPIVDHGNDVAAVLDQLLRRSIWRARLEIAGARQLAETDLAKLACLAFLHDFGKCNSGFQARRDPTAPIVGHCEQAAPVLCGEVDALPAPGVRLLDTLNAWCTHEHVAAMLAHHGRPLRALYWGEGAGDGGGVVDSNAEERRKNTRFWIERPTSRPLSDLAEVCTEAQRRFPSAFTDHSPLPEQPAFVALFAGLLTLADWIGSDEARFPLEGPRGDARRRFAESRAREALAELDLIELAGTATPEFARAFGFAPRPAQVEAADPGLGSIALLEAETGSGKTEAALWRFVELAGRGLVDGLYFALPTRTAATQLHRRVDEDLAKLFGNAAPRAVLAVPGYIRAGTLDGERTLRRDVDGTRLPGFDVLWPDEEKERGRDGRWAAASPLRFLAARVAVGTIDQALLAGLQVRHAHFRAAALARSLLVVDEVHASDAYMTEILHQVIRNHVRVGGHVLLLSATLGSVARARLTGQCAPSLEAAEQIPYPAISGSQAPPRPTDAGTAKPAVRFSLRAIIGDAHAIAGEALEAARRGASVLVVRNQVSDAVAVQQALESLVASHDPLLFELAQVASLHHGRFAPADRRALDRRVEAIFGKADPETGVAMERRPIVLCGTQTLEQSLDIDADLLITDLAPMDVLLQRLGRLHRHGGRKRPAGFEAPNAIVLVPGDRDLRRFERDRGHGLGPFDDGSGIYPNLGIIEATWSLLETRAATSGVIEVPGDCRMLVERATHPEAVERAAARAGIDVTRVEGAEGMDRVQGRTVRLDMTTPFTALSFPEEGRIGTRLGALDRRILLPEGTIGPFGWPIDVVDVPHWMSSGIGEATHAEVNMSGEVLHLGVGEAAFLYDRLGLRDAT